MEYYMYRGEDELIHWGIKGMRWGIRRFQNKDGSLTAAGKKRRASEESQLKEREKRIKSQEQIKARNDKIAAKKAELDARERALRNPSKPEQKSVNNNSKSINEMNDDELRAYTNRLRLEKEYYDARKNLAVANPKQVSTGKKFINGVLNDVIVPAAKNAGREYVEKFMKDKLGLNKTDTMTKLKKTAEELKITKEIKEYRRDIKNIENGGGNTPEVKSWEDMIKKQTWEKNDRDEKALKETADKLTKTEKELANVRKQLEKERNKNKK